MCVSSFRCPARNAHAPYCHLWPAPLYNKCYIFWVCVCSLKFPARNTHAPYCHLWPAPLYNIFPHYLINGKIKKKSYWIWKMGFEFVSMFKQFFFSNLNIVLFVEFSASYDSLITYKFPSSNSPLPNPTHWNIYVNLMYIAPCIIVVVEE